MSIDLPRLRRRMVELAMAEYRANPQEEGQPPEGNEGAWATKVLNGGQKPGVVKYTKLPFCVGGYLWFLKQCLAEQGAKLPFYYTLQASVLWRFFIEREAVHAADGLKACPGLPLDDERAGDGPLVAGSCVYLPQPGDAVFTYRGAETSKPGHVYMVKEVAGGRLIGLGANEHLFALPSVPALRLTDRGPLSAIPRLVGVGSLDFLGQE